MQLAVASAPRLAETFAAVNTCRAFACLTVWDTIAYLWDTRCRHAFAVGLPSSSTTGDWRLATGDGQQQRRQLLDTPAKPPPLHPLLTPFHLLSPHPPWRSATLCCSYTQKISLSFSTHCLKNKYWKILWTTQKSAQRKKKKETIFGTIFN